jgi:hypothetical protein
MHFLNYEVHEVKKYFIFLRDLRALRGENLPFLKSSSLVEQRTVLKAQAAK